MNEEVNSFLKWNLEEAYSDFNGIIAEMKEKNIPIDYDEVIADEKDYYSEVSRIMSQLDYYLSEANDLRDITDEIRVTKFKIGINYAFLYVASLFCIRLFNEIFDTSNLDDMIKYIAGMFLGSTYIKLMKDEIEDYKSDTKEKRDAINKIRTLKEEYKETHDKLVLKIDSMYDLNTKLWNVYEREIVKNRQK
jgi:hypothetical protein